MGVIDQTKLGEIQPVFPEPAEASGAVERFSIGAMTETELLALSRDRRAAPRDTYRRVREIFGRGLLLSLEILVAADLVHSVAVQPTRQERPEPCHRMHMACTKALSILIAGKLAPSIVDTLMVVSPGRQAYMLYSSVYTRVSSILVSMMQGAIVFCCTWVSIDYDLTTPLEHSKDW